MNKSATLEPRPPPSMSWARARLRLGQTNVGAWVLVALAVVVWRPSLPSGGLMAEAMVWVGLVATYIVLQSPGDLVGGYLLPARHGRLRGGFVGWVRAWSRGVAVHAGVWLALGWLLLGISQGFGIGVAVLVPPAVGLGLLAAQRVVLGASTWMTVVQAGRALDHAARDAGLDPSRVVQVKVPAEASFVGGWVGMPGRERLLVPEAWTRDPALLRVVLTRRAFALRSGSRSKGAWAAWIWNTVGWLAALAVVPGAGVDSAGGLLMASAGFTLWAFLGLLTLPSLSRRAVLALDQHAARALGRDVVVQAIRQLDRDQEDERERPALQGRIFHPVPTPAARAAALDEDPAPTWALWRVTRMALFLGWAQVSWLSRVVHCNAGRPGVWVVLPGD